MLCEPDLYNTLPLQTGTYNATIRIPGCWLEDMWLRDLKDDINVNLNFNSNGCVETGTATNVTVNAVSILLKQHEMTLTDESQISKMFNTGVFKKRFISYNQATSNQTLTVSAANIVLLNAIRNNVAFLFFGVRSSKSSAAGAVKKFVRRRALSIANFQNFILACSSRSMHLSHIPPPSFRSRHELMVIR